MAKHVQRFIKDELNSRNLSIQAAAWGNNGFPVIEFTNCPLGTSLADLTNDVALVHQSLEGVEEESRNIHTVSSYIFYTKRPVELEKMCLANFVYSMERMGNGLPISNQAIQTSKKSGQAGNATRSTVAGPK